MKAKIFNIIETIFFYEAVWPGDAHRQFLSRA